MGEFADFANQGGRNGEGLFQREYRKPKMPKNYPTEWKPPVDPRDDYTDKEIWADFLENGFQ